MKRLLLIPLILLMFLSCSKKSTPAPQPPMVNINGMVYPTVVIGGQTWTAANYNGGYNNGSEPEGGIVYNNGTDTLSHGLLYTTAEAEAITLPAGWRLPTAADYNKLLATIGATEPDPSTNQVYEDVNSPLVKTLISTSGWINGSGTNATGFNVLPVGFFGYGDTGLQTFQGRLNTGMFVCSTEFSGALSAFTIIEYPTGATAGLNNYPVYPTDRLSVRFVKDN